MLASCAVKQPPPPPTNYPSESAPPTGDVADSAPLGPALQRARSRWVPVRWSELPGFEQDALHEAWNAWVKNCERPGATFARLCSEVRRLTLATPQEQRNWMRARLQPYRVEPLGAPSEGLLTSYFEPFCESADRQGPLPAPRNEPPLPWPHRSCCC